MIKKIKPNFANAYEKANERLVLSNTISKFPFSPIELINEFTNIKCKSFETAKKYGVDINSFGSESAIIVRFGSKSIIFYDETKPQTHINFSILREIGHEELGHDFKINDNEKYGVYEVETNYFASQLLMPEQLVREFQRRGLRPDVNFLIRTFGVSLQAANKRIETLAKTKSEWYSRAQREFDDIILWKYDEFLNSICPYDNNFNFEDEYLLQEERNSWY